MFKSLHAKLFIGFSAFVIVAIMGLAYFAYKAKAYKDPDVPRDLAPLASGTPIPSETPTRATSTATNPQATETETMSPTIISPLNIEINTDIENYTLPLDAVDSKNGWQIFDRIFQETNSKKSFDFSDTRREANHRGKLIITNAYRYSLSGGSDFCVNNELDGALRGSRAIMYIELYDPLIFKYREGIPSGRPEFTYTGFFIGYPLGENGKDIGDLHQLTPDDSFARAFTLPGCNGLGIARSNIRDMVLVFLPDKIQTMEGLKDAVFQLAPQLSRAQDGGFSPILGPLGGYSSLGLYYDSGIIAPTAKAPTPPLPIPSIK